MKNSVELIDYMGGDKLHSLAAWASTFAEFDLDLPDNIENRVDVIVNHIINNGKKKRSIQDLLAYLAENEHTSPFRFSSFVFACNTDIATHIQKLKHRVILEAENGESARYKELKEDKFYLPEDWKFLKTKNKEVVNKFGTDTWIEILEEYTNLGNFLYHESIKDLTPILGKKRTKESARYFKTYNSQINTLNKVSFDGLMQFYFKRHNPEIAQVEIAELAMDMLNAVISIPGNPFKYSIKAFIH
ncbi:MAG: Bacteriophage vB NpeS-2AV2 [Bacteroidota bacterium]|jgi:thymidylate synthase ThyX